MAVTTFLWRYDDNVTYGAINDTCYNPVSYVDILSQWGIFGPSTCVEFSFFRISLDIFWFSASGSDLMFSVTDEIFLSRTIYNADSEIIF